MEGQVGGGSTSSGNCGHVKGGNFVCEDGGKIQPVAIGVTTKIQQVATRVAKVVRKN